eukprot:209386-Amphidinium_carterae.1
MSLAGQRYAFVCSYAPTGGSDSATRGEFYDLWDKHRDTFPKGCKVVAGGDWNAHFGKDHVGDFLGPHCISTPTSRHSTAMADLLNNVGYFHVDSHLPVRHRGTWRSTLHHQHYELDYFVSSINPARRCWKRLRTFAASFSDHFGKSVQLQLGKHTGVFKRSTTSDGVPDRLDLNAMRGPTPAAVKHRERFAALVEAKLTRAELPSQGQWDYVVQAMRETAESLVGRQRPRLVCPILDSMRPQMLRHQRSLRASWEQVRLAPTPTEAKLRKGCHQDLRRRLRAEERSWKRRS